MHCRSVVYINNAEKISLEEEAYLISFFNPCRLTTVIKNHAVLADKSHEMDFKVYRRECGGKLFSLLKVIKNCKPVDVLVFKESEISIPFLAFIMMWVWVGRLPKVYYFEADKINSLRKLSFFQVFCGGNLIAKSFKDFTVNQIPKILYIPDGLIARIIALRIPGRYRNADSENCHESRLLIDYSYTYKSNQSTGIQRVVRNVVKYSKAYAAEKSMTILPVTLENGHFIEIDINVNHPLRKMAWLFPKTTLFLRIVRHGVLIYKTDTLLMLDSSWDLNIWPSLDVFKRSGGRIIGILYDLIPVSNPEFVADFTARCFRQWLIKSFDYYDCYIAISQTVMNNLRDYIMDSGRDIAKYKFDYFRLGADFSINEVTSQTNIREPLTAMFTQNKSVYIAVSTIEPRKNHALLIKAFNRLWEKNVDVTLCIIGKIGWKVEGLIAEIRTHPRYGSKLFMWNDLSDDELVFCYRNAKLSLFPSFIEGFGLPIIESLNYGLPVLASNIPIHREVGQDMIDYFDLNSVYELVQKIIQIETGKTILKKCSEKLPTVTWEQSAYQLFDKVLVRDQSA